MGNVNGIPYLFCKCSYKVLVWDRSSTFQGKLLTQRDVKPNQKLVYSSCCHSNWDSVRLVFGLIKSEDNAPEPFLSLFLFLFFLRISSLGRLSFFNSILVLGWCELLKITGKISTRKFKIGLVICYNWRCSCVITYRHISCSNQVIRNSCWNVSLWHCIMPVAGAVCWYWKKKFAVIVFCISSSWSQYKKHFNFS